MNDHAALVLSDFKGTFDRGEEEAVPIGYFHSSQNVRYINKGVKTRYGSSLNYTLTTVRRAATYERIGEAKRLLILDGSGNLYDSTNLSTPILSIVAMTDFSMVTLYNRAYITPHDGVTGLPGEKVYVYEGSGLARGAAGDPPSSFDLTATDSASSGHVEAGAHVIAVCYETESGYVTAPGGYVTITNAGSRKIDIGNIQNGPAGTVAKLLVATKRLIDFDGDFAHQTYYFVPDGTIADNVTTTLTIDFYDADLEADASYLLEQLAEIPAGVGIDSSSGYLAVWGEDENPSIVRVSKSGEPESFNAVDGFVTVNPGDAGGGIKHCCEYRSQLVIFKESRTYAVQPTTDPPAEWIVASVDGSNGTTPHGIGRSLDHGAAIEDRLFLATRTGFRIFTGSFSPLDIISNPIDDIWARINPDYFHTLEVAVDTENFIIYIAVPLDTATSPSHILVCNYNEGLSIEGAKWTIWAFPSAPRTIVTQLINKEVVLKFGVLTGNIYKMDPDETLDYGNALDTWVEFPHYPVGDFEDNINNFVGIRARIRGVGDVSVTGKGADGISTFTGETITLANLPGKSNFSGFNFNDEKCSIKLRQNVVNGHFTLTRFTLYVSEIWGDRPRV